MRYGTRACRRGAGQHHLAGLSGAGGHVPLLSERGAAAFEQGGDKPFALSSGRDGSAPCEARLFLVPWQGDSAFALVTMPAGGVSATADDAAPGAPPDEASPAAAPAEASPAAPAEDAPP